MTKKTLMESKDIAKEVVVSSGLLQETDNDVQHYNRTMLQGTYLDSDGPHTSLLCKASEILREKGVAGGELKIGLNALLVLISPQLNDPQALEIVEDEARGAADIVELCSKMVPENAVLKLLNLDRKKLFEMRQDLPYKAIIGADSKGFRKAATEIKLLIDDGSVTDQVTYHTPLGPRTEEVRVEGPTSIILIARNPEDAILSPPSALRVDMTNDQSRNQPSGDCDDDMFDAHCQIMSTCLERIKGVPVRIPFSAQIEASLVESGVRYPRETASMIFRAIRNITRINNPPPPSVLELWAKHYGMEPRKMAKVMKHEHIDPDQKLLDNVRANNCDKDGHLIATKVGYAHFRWLMGDLIKKSDEHLTDRQRRVFSAIHRVNEGRLGATTFTSQSEIEKMVTLQRSTDARVDVPGIFKAVNTDGGPEISLSTLNFDLQVLLKKGFIDRQRRRRGSESKLAFYYAVTKPSLDSAIKFPQPADIDDPVYNKNPVQVVNPLTGAVETI